MSSGEKRGFDLEDVVSTMSRSYGVDIGAASGSLLDGVGSWYSRRKHGLRTVAAGLLIGSLAACGGTGGVDPDPNPDPDPDPDPEPGSRVECIDDTAANYANEIGLELDVSGYDSNDDRGVEGPGGCFTADERDWIDALNVVEDEGLVSEATGAALDEFVDYFYTVDGLVVGGFLETYKHWKRDRQANPDMEFTPETIGWIPLDIMIPDLHLPGKFHAENGQLSPYEHDPKVFAMGLPDWDPRDGITSTYLSEFGVCAECDDAQDQSFSSTLDIAIEREFVNYETGEFEILWYPVHNGSLTEATIENVTLRQEFGEGYEQAVPHTSVDIKVSMPVSPDAAPLFGGVDEVVFFYYHTVPFQEPRRIESVDELPEHLQPGSILEPGQQLGWNDPYRAAQVFDIIVAVPRGQGFPDVGPAGSSTGRYVVLDPSAANYAYADGQDPRWTRFAQSEDWMWGPFRNDDGGLVFEPDTPFTPSVSTTGEEFVYNTDE